MSVIANPVALGAATKKTHFDTAFNWAVPTITEKSIDYTMLDVKGCELVNCTTGAGLLTVTLPTLADNQGSRVIVVKDKDSGAGEVKVDGEGAELLLYPGGTAAAMYVGLAGQSAEFVGMVDGWQWVGGVVQPVPGEPSLGTPHPHNAILLNNYDPGSTPTTLQIILTVAGGIANPPPLGTKKIVFWGSFKSANVADYIYVDDRIGTVGNNHHVLQYSQVANQPIGFSGEVLLDSAMSFNFYSSSSAISGVYMVMTEYTM